LCREEALYGAALRSGAETSMPYRVTLTVKESRGDCPYYKVGDKIVFEDAEIC
jgi:hypothetical protein